MQYSTDEKEVTISKYPNSGLDMNYCRNPDKSKTLWCYVMNESNEKVKEECDIRVAK